MGKRGYVGALGDEIRGLRLRPDQEAALNDLTRVHGTSRSALIREAVDDLITKLSKGEKK